MSTAAPAIPGYCVDPQCQCHTGPDSARVRTPFPDEGVPPYCCNRCGRHGPKPATVVMPLAEISTADMEARIHGTMAQHGQVLQDFHKVWYECGHTWTWTSFLGVGLMKNPMDLWAYQDLITQQRPKTILETGTFAGGSALWFAVLMDALDIEGGKILTVDLDDHRQCDHERITFVAGDCTNSALVAALTAEVEHPLLISLDSDHSAAHVRKELELYAPLVHVGEYIVVEDTNVSWGNERGARGGLEDFLRAHPGEFRQDILLEKHLITCHPGGWLQRIASPPHA